MKFIFPILCLLLLSVTLACPAMAWDGETLYNGDYCFCEDDFSDPEANPLDGIYVAAVPEAQQAAILLGGRIIRAGDVLPAEALSQLRLQPLCRENGEAVLCYQPIRQGSLHSPEQISVRICSGKNESPVAHGAELETYKNIPNDGKLSGEDPEGAQLSFRLEEAPKRGSVEIKADGSFVYTPNKNKVGQDSFTFTVTDEAGNSSAPATVQIRILKPTESMSFADMQGNMDHFEAMWLCQQKIAGGRQLGETACFVPEEPLTRGEFLVMAMELWDVAADTGEAVGSYFTDCEGSWLEGHLSAALRQGIVHGESSEQGLVFRPNEPIRIQEAAVMLQNILQLPVPAAATEERTWSSDALLAMADAGITLPQAEGELTRAQAACLLYESAKLS